MKRVIFFLVLVLPVLVSGFTTDTQKQINHRLPYYQQKDNPGSLNQIRIPYQAFTRNRSWRLRSEIYRFDIDNDGDMEISDIDSLYYSSSFPNRIDSVRTFLWDDMEYEWYVRNKNIYIYDATGEFIEEIDEYSHLYSYPKNKILCNYDTQNRLIEHQFGMYDSTSLDYIFESGCVYTYNASSLAEKLSYFYAPHSNYQDFGKVTYSTDIQGRIVSASGEWSSDSLDWHPNDYITYTYNDNDTSNGEDYIYYLSHYLFTDYFDFSSGFGMVSQEIEQYSWNSNLNEWSNSIRYLYTFNTDNQLTSIVRSRLDTTWFDVSLYTISYDTNSNIDTLALYLWDQDETDWGAPIQLYIYGWEQANSNEDDTVTPVPMNVSVYPNPFTSSVNITLHSKSNAPVKAAVYNIKGQLIKTLDNSKSLTWDGTEDNNQSVSNGIYFIKAEQDGRIVTSRLIRIK